VRSLAAAALFVLGLYMGLRIVAALLRVSDLWYRIGTEWPRVAGGIAAWVGLAVGITLAVDGVLRAAFLCGMAGYVVVHVLVYAGTRIYVMRQYREHLRI
jgi:hypothetical protein